MLHKKKSLQLALLAGATAATVYTVAPWVKASRYQADDIRARSAAPSQTIASAAAPNAHAGTPTAEVLHGPSGSTRTVPDSNGDAFVNVSWVPPAPPVVVAPPRALATPAPTAPPLPFTFVGLLEKGAEHPMAFVAKGDVLLVVAAGQTIDDNNYRVETLSPQKIVVTYLPMGIQQTLNFRGPNQ